MATPQPGEILTWAVDRIDRRAKQLFGRTARKSLLQTRQELPGSGGFNTGWGCLKERF